MVIHSLHRCGVDGLLSTKHPHEMPPFMHRPVHRRLLDAVDRYALHSGWGVLNSSDLNGQGLDERVGGGIVPDAVLDFLVRVDDRRVVAVEEAANGWP